MPKKVEGQVDERVTFKNAARAQAAGVICFCACFLPVVASSIVGGMKFDPTDAAAKARAETWFLIWIVSLFLLVPMGMYAALILWSVRVVTSLLVTLACTPVLWAFSIFVVVGKGFAG